MASFKTPRAPSLDTTSMVIAYVILSSQVYSTFRQSNPAISRTHQFRIHLH